MKENLWKKTTLTPEEASELTGMPAQKIRVGLQRGAFDFGCAFKTTDAHIKHQYVIYTALLRRYVNG